MNKITVADALKTIRQLYQESSEEWDITIDDSFEDDQDEISEAESECLAVYISVIGLLQRNDPIWKCVAHDHLLDAKKLEDEWLNCSCAQRAIEAIDSINTEIE